MKVANRWPANEVDGHIMELLDTVASDGPQTIQDASGRLFDVVPRQSTEQDQTSIDLPDTGPSLIERRRAERANMTEQEIREDEEFYAEYQRGIDEARREMDSGLDWVNPFAWVEEMTEEEVDAWEQRLDEARKRRTEIQQSGQR